MWLCHERDRDVSDIISTSYASMKLVDSCPIPGESTTINQNNIRINPDVILV